MGARYHFEDAWTVPGPVDLAWRMVDDLAAWPAWWPDYRRVERVSPDVAHGVGVRWRVWVRSDLPYTVDFTLTVLQHEPPRYVRISVEGFFNGTIEWRLEGTGQGTRLILTEDTETRWALINLVARLGGRWLFEANHRAAMRRGEHGMRTVLAAGYVPPVLDA
jgi:carbon monoxide dehydrogenase subunit G